MAIINFFEEHYIFSCMIIFGILWMWYSIHTAEEVDCDDDDF